MFLYAEHEYRVTRHSGANSAHIYNAAHAKHVHFKILMHGNSLLFWRRAHIFLKLLTNASIVSTLRCVCGYSHVRQPHYLSSDYNLMLINFAKFQTAY